MMVVSRTSMMEAVNTPIRISQRYGLTSFSAVTAGAPGGAPAEEAVGAWADMARRLPFYSYCPPPPGTRLCWVGLAGAGAFGGLTGGTALFTPGDARLGA